MFVFYVHMKKKTVQNNAYAGQGLRCRFLRVQTWQWKYMLLKHWLYV